VADDRYQSRQTRLGKNQALFRAVNERVDDLAKQESGPGADQLCL
jgi:hypothetical protein